jgi:hypothetical protein
MSLRWLARNAGHLLWRLNSNPSGNSNAAATASVVATPSIPWFRKRWFAVLCMITITPIASLLALTGDVYYKNKAGSTVTLPKNYKTAMMLGTFPVAVSDVWWPITDADADHCSAVCWRSDRVQEIRTLP